MFFSEASLIMLIRWIPTMNMGKAKWPSYWLSGGLQSILGGSVLKELC